MNRIEKIASQRMSVAVKAARLYNQRGRVDDAEVSERNKLNALREVNRSPEEVKVLATERMIGHGNESKDLPPNANAKKHGVSVARLFEIGKEREPKGFGTGFLIAPNILITNNHVFRNIDEAVNCAANFLYEKDETTKRVANGVNFKLRPDIFFYTCEDLDFSLVYVESNPYSGTPALPALGILPLIETKGKVKLSSPINIIQYPQGGMKKYTTEENTITNIDDNLGIIYYTTDTEVGSSGSPCFNKYWEVAALHYTGVPKMNDNGDWLTKDNKIWDAKTMSEDKIDWIANAGKSISKIIDHIKNAPVGPNEKKYMVDILSNSKDPLKNNLEKNTTAVYQQEKNNSAMGNIIMNFNANTNVYINQGAPATAYDGKAAQISSVEGGRLLLEKKETFDENYSNRKGYDESFIPGFEVPFPTVRSSRKNELFKNFGASEPYRIPYHHYSLVMNKDRRMVMWSAANVDYNEKFRDERSRQDLGNGAWRLDPRIPEKYQIQASEFYDPATLVDKGHIVRRDDNCWARLKNGQTDILGIEYANADTFHWTNCTPQHEAFNRDMIQYAGTGKWGVLENEIKKQLEFPENDPDNDNKDYGQRACVLAGPILSDNDPEYMDIQYPLRFWKVFAIKSETEGNLVYGFILSQEDNVNEDGLEKEGLPRFNRLVKTMQVSLATIENESDVLFDQSLHQYDVMAGHNGSSDAIEKRGVLENFNKKNTRTRGRSKAKARGSNKKRHSAKIIVDKKIFNEEKVPSRLSARGREFRIHNQTRKAKKK